MTKTITNNIILKDFDTFEIIENIKEVDKLQKVYEGCTLENDINTLKAKFITKFDDLSTALNYFNCEISHNYVNFNSDCTAYEVHEFVLKCYSSDYIRLVFDDVPTAYLLNGGFIVE